MTERQPEADQRAAMAAFLAEHSRPWHHNGWGYALEEQMAHVANGGTLRPGHVARAMHHRWRRGRVDDAGYVSDGTGWHWEPDAGDVA